ncbi:MAG: cobalt-precorrin-5B (C(1))-methyltransferase [Oscillatoriales cyanobacterium]|uniref:cobalt-precorrin-5B (C(1))-methyltransferase CbiD n=1 Tax=Microcoleus sp. PH2017_05_CCC_O_A TaxID=2798816 RepID=UPI001D629570|nr:cobalt-precorrin-5B (C(1))-methyltransferase CbiD [Microcoleus sp. PH2017_05_CCC_O_A]MCC3467228.1 cobalt-precorrin-5B (C(1))-methyltransferase [Microcoleus sp. PH2017_06_SFM_O_A]TAG02426.1 MAG: cobalt-precorrin-5B (C(1))-methyltransferase [Oscillatoriales cyanobacterium]MCC3439086.1 cobalt-precorrin-5B (C(1))-methyltransferase [Microcoleus sp. PH2017_05_CCC_O_A]TAG14102.1 MAG: cobalt-precorrin-5B (C(1))-methyltransferase [Oscillatoriales cyanobacterium]TAG42136.1 MAG: cobalt-precorrin-5B (C
MTKTQPLSGYTLPVFACAAALAALRCLRVGTQSVGSVSVDLLEPPITAEIAIEQASVLKTGTALGVTRSDPGDNLDLTRNTPVWAMVELLGEAEGEGEQIVIVGGEGIGHHKVGGGAAIYDYAMRLLRSNLSRELAPGERITVTLILPSGRQLATRTSNEAFGVVEGLSLLGTTGISQPLSAPGQLEIYREQLQQKAELFDTLVFCIGENGSNLARQLGIDPQRLVKTANWLGPLLAEAGCQGVRSILLFGYHGKLMKLAAGIFHTHHHLADGRREILTAFCAKAGMPAAACSAIFAAATAEEALGQLRALDAATGSHWVDRIYGDIAREIDLRSSDCIFTHTNQRIPVGSVMFGRDRKIIVKSDIGDTFLTQIC